MKYYMWTFLGVNYISDIKRRFLRHLERFKCGLGIEWLIRIITGLP